MFFFLECRWIIGLHWGSIFFQLCHDHHDGRSLERHLATAFISAGAVGEEFLFQFSFFGYLSLGCRSFAIDYQVCMHIHTHLRELATVQIRFACTGSSLSMTKYNTTHCCRFKLPSKTLFATVTEDLGVGKLLIPFFYAIGAGAACDLLFITTYGRCESYMYVTQRSKSVQIIPDPCGRHVGAQYIVLSRHGLRQLSKETEWHRSGTQGTAEGSIDSGSLHALFLDGLCTDHPFPASYCILYSFRCAARLVVAVARDSLLWPRGFACSTLVVRVRMRRAVF